MFSCIRDDPKNIPNSSPLAIQEFKEILEELYLVDAFVSNKNQQYHRDSASRQSNYASLVPGVRCRSTWSNAL